MNGPDTHWTMFIVGGLAFLIIGRINEYFTWEIPIWLQSIIGTIVVTVLEFISGCVLNIFLDLELEMTDYILMNKKIKNPHSVLSECGFITL